MTYDNLTLSLALAVVATVVSIIGWSVYAYKYYDRGSGRTLSQSAPMAKQSTIVYRAIMWFCCSLFVAVAALGLWPFYPLAGVLLAITAILGSLAAIYLPTTRWRTVIHDVAAYGLAAGMVLTSIYFVSVSSGAYWLAQAALLATILFCGTMALVNRRNYIYFQMVYIYAAHVAVIVMLCSLI